MFHVFLCRTFFLYEYFSLQDIVAKILSFSQQRPRALCILSGTGTVSSVTLRQPASTGVSVTYEVEAFNYLSLSLSLSLSHTHTHTHIIPLRCLLSQSLVEFLFWEWYEGWNFSFLCAKTLYTNPYRAQHINYGFF